MAGSVGITSALRLYRHQHRNAIRQTYNCASSESDALREIFFGMLISIPQQKHSPPILVHTTAIMTQRQKKSTPRPLAGVVI